MSATLKVSRKTIGMEVRRDPYDVIVDGERAGSVALHETTELQVAAGRHTVQVRSGRNSSRTLTFDVVEDGVIAFQSGGKRPLPIFLVSFVVPSLALSLRRDF